MIGGAPKLSIFEKIKEAGIEKATTKLKKIQKRQNDKIEKREEKKAATAKADEKETPTTEVARAAVGKALRAKPEPEACNNIFNIMFWVGGIMVLGVIGWYSSMMKYVKMSKKFHFIMFCIATFGGLLFWYGGEKCKTS